MTDRLLTCLSPTACPRRQPCFSFYPQLRAEEKALAASPSSSAFAPGTMASVLQSKVAPWLRDSAWPRLILVGFHVAEVGERTVPVASLAAALGDWAFLTPVAMTPAMVVRYAVRRRRDTLGGGSGLCPRYSRSSGCRW